MTDPGRRMGIGEFARAARLSIKALRHYDREGLLAPAHVDPATGYRYYEPAQLATALRIGLLRRAEVSLPALRVLLHDPERAHEVLAAEHARIEREAARATRALALVDSLEKSVAAHLPVTVHRIPERTMLWREGVADADTLDRAASELIAEVLSEARRLGLDASAPVVGRYPAALDGEVSFGVGLDVGAHPTPAPGPRVVTMPGGVFAGVDFTGSAALLPAAYGVLFAWLAAAGVDATGPVREYYLTDPAEVGEDAMLTRVLHPVPGGDHLIGQAQS